MDKVKHKRQAEDLKQTKNREMIAQISPNQKTETKDVRSLLAPDKEEEEGSKKQLGQRPFSHALTAPCERRKGLSLFSLLLSVAFVCSESESHFAVLIPSN